MNPAQHRTLRGALGVTVALAVAACSAAPAGAPGGQAGAVPRAPSGGPLDLAGVCPATVVMQQDWQPEAEHGAMYAVVGPGYRIDADRKAVTGPLVTQGVDTGVQVEVRPGGATVGFQQVPALMYLDDTITVGAVTTTDGIRSAAAGKPTTAVTAQLTTSPQILMWDPASHPGKTTIREVAAEGVPVLTSGEIIPALLGSHGVMTAAQSDTSYDGSPARFVTEPRVLQQGFATSEPYLYQNEITQWAKPVAFEPLSKYGWSLYPEPLAVRTDRLAQLRPCLTKLVPIMQRAQIDYLRNPGPTNDLIVALVAAYQTSWTYSKGLADFSARQQLDGGYVTDDPATGVFGRFDPGRMQQTVDTFVPLFQQTGQLSGPAPTAESLYTNEFLDPSLSLKPR